ncbi:hypothetical protein ECAE60S_03243 [Eoetvoesiella caeni]
MHNFNHSSQVPSFLCEALPAAWLEAHFSRIGSDRDTPITDDDGSLWLHKLPKPSWSNPYRRPTWQVDLQLLSLCALKSSVEKILEHISLNPTTRPTGQPSAPEELFQSPS